jgi:hypothetical protein
MNAHASVERVPRLFSPPTICPPAEPDPGGARAPLHRDPFDRVLIIQALVEGLTIVTHDRRFEPYGVTVLWT